MSENENPLLKPEEVKRIRREEKEESNIQKIVENKITELPIPKQETGKYVNKGQTVKVTLESAGRFGNPKEIWLKDYTTKHINDLVTVNEEDLLETVVAILQECVVEPKGFEIANCTNEDLFEIMLAMKMSFDSTFLKYRWYHKCQDEKQDEKERQVSEYLIDLTQAEYKPIEVLDEELKLFYKDLFSKLPKEQVDSYLESKYGAGKEVTIKQAIDEIKIQDPFYIPSLGDDIIVFEYIKIKHMLEASRRANEEWNPKIRYVQSKKYKGSVQEQKAIKEGELEQLKRLKGKTIIGYAQALCLRGVKNKSTGEFTEIKSDLEKIKYYESLPKNVMFGFVNALEKIKFGVSYDVEIQCDLCESDNTERRLLQRDISFIELLPLSNDSNDSTSRKSQKSRFISVYF